MGVFGGGGGGGSNDRQVIETKQTNEIPKYLQEFSKETLDQARDLRERPFEAYTGQRIAQLGPDYQHAFDLTKNNAGVWTAPWEAGADTTAGVAGRSVTPWTQADIGAYMDPYLSNVVDRTLSEVNRQAGIERNQIRGQMASQGAYGGSRHGVIEAEQRRNTEDLRNNLVASLMSAGYQDAGNRFYADEANRLASDQLKLGAGQQLADFGRLASQLGYADAAAMLDIGERQRQVEQAGLDIAYADFLREWNYPIEQLNLMSATAAQQPYATSSVGEQMVYGGGGGGGSPFAQALGAFGSLAGLGLQAYSAFSSREFKEDDAPPETILEGVKKIPVRAWRYRPEMGLGTERHVGPYAEDWQETFGLGDGKTINLVDAVGVNLRATQELAEQVDDLAAFAAMIAAPAAQEERV